MSFQLLVVSTQDHRRQIRPVLRQLRRYAGWLEATPLACEVDVERGLHVLSPPNFVIIGSASLDVYRSTTGPDRLPDEVLQRSPETAGLRVLTMLRKAARERWDNPDLPIWVGYTTPITNQDVDTSSVIREKGGVPFLVDAATTDHRTASGARTIYALIQDLDEKIEEFLIS